MLAVGLLHPAPHKATGTYAKASATACGQAQRIPDKGEPDLFRSW